MTQKRIYWLLPR